MENEQDKIDLLNMLGDRSLELRAWAETELKKGRTLHSFASELAAVQTAVRGWLIGRFG
jgi:hypothetical protein